MCGNPITHAFELGMFSLLPSWPKRGRAPRFRAQPVRVGPGAETVGPQKGIPAWWTVAICSGSHGPVAGTPVKDCSKLWEVGGRFSWVPGIAICNESMRARVKGGIKYLLGKAHIQHVESCCDPLLCVHSVIRSMTTTQDSEHTSCLCL